MSYILHDFLTSWLPDLLTYLLTYVMTSWFHVSRTYLFTSWLPDFTVYLSRYKSDSSNFGTQSQIKSRMSNMGVMKSHAEIQRAYRSRLKQQNPELLRMHDREKWRRQCLKRRSQRTLHKHTESGSTQYGTEASRYSFLRQWKHIKTCRS